MAYIGKSPTGTGVRQRYYFTATGGETSLSGTDDNGLTLSYSDGAYVDVLLNGIELVAGTDYNTSTANTIAGLAALAASDVVTVTVYDIFTVADTVSAKNGGTFSGNVALAGNELILDADADTSITADTDDQIDFKTAGSDTMHLTSTGLGIGTSSPDADLSLTSPVYTSGGDDNGIRFQNQNNNGDAILQSYYSGTTPSALLHGANIYLSTGAAFTPFDNTKANSYILQNTNGNIEFATASTGTASERMRIDTSGRVIMGATSYFYTDAVLQIDQTNTASGNNGCIALQNRNASGASGVRTVICRNSTGTYVGGINNTSTATSFQTTSDHRLKENDVDMTGAIERVKQLQPKRFNFIIDADTTVDGFMAHEVQTVVPEAISGTHNEVDDDGNPVYQGIDQSKLVPLLTGALKEAIAKIEALETRVQALEDA